MSRSAEESEVLRPSGRREFDTAFDDLASTARRVGFRLLGDRHLADEVAQEALARAYVRWRRIEPYAEAWVARVAANLALDEHRRRARQARYLAADHRPGSGDDQGDVVQLRLALVEALRNLPRRQREVVVLRYLADVSEADAAGVLGCSRGTVKQHASRGLAALRRALPEQGPEPDRPPGGDHQPSPEDTDVRAPG